MAVATRCRRAGTGLPAWIVATARASRDHWLFTVLLTAGLALRAVTQVAYRPALVYIDSDRYLRGSFGEDPLGYRVLLWPLQRAGGLAVVAAAQHILGLAMALTLYAVLRRRGAWRWAAAVAAVPVLLDGYQLQAEQTIMPDVLFEALIVAGLALLLWRPSPAAWLTGVAGLLLGAATDVRQVGEVLIVPALAFVLVCAVGWRRRLTYGALITASFAVPVLAYMAAQGAVDGHFALTQRSSYILYGRTAAAADCATLKLPPGERALCPSPMVVATLGVDGIMSQPQGPLLSYRPPPGVTTETMAARFERAVLRQQPLAVVRSVDYDFLKLFAITRQQRPGDTPISRWQFQTAYPTYPPLITLSYVAQVKPGGGRPTATKPLAVMLRAYQLHGGYAPGPLLAIAALTGLAGAYGVVGRRRAHAALASACMLFTATALAVALASDAFEFSWRYQLPAVVLLPSAGVLGIAAVAARTKFELRAWPGKESLRRPAGQAPAASAAPAPTPRTAPAPRTAPTPRTAPAVKRPLPAPGHQGGAST